MLTILHKKSRFLIAIDCLIAVVGGWRLSKSGDARLIFIRVEKLRQHSAMIISRIPESESFHFTLTTHAIQICLDAQPHLLRHELLINCGIE